VQPFHGLALPLSLTLSKDIAIKYAERAKMDVQLLEMPPFRFRAKRPNERIRIGY
jgi:protein O-GlcNAc transferase